jgi:hypothetical protein
MNPVNGMNAMDFSLHHLPPHVLQQAGVVGGAVGARPQKPVRERKDKNAPKRNWTAYQFYVEEVRFSRMCQ